MEETIILNFEVDQGKAERSLEKIEGLLLDNKKAQQDLTKAYKAGRITQEEYVKENIRLQGNIKKEQEQKKALIRTLETEANSRNAMKLRVNQLTKEYDGLNLSQATGIKRADALEKELAQLNSQLTKGDKSAGLFKNQIGNYPKAFQDATKDINIAGTSVGGFTTRLLSLANPITAAVGLVGALGASYAKSTVGAKDLEFAQNRLSSAFTLLNNQLAEFISSGEDGEGIVSSLLDNFLDTYASGISALSDLAAKNIELLQDLERKEIEVRGNISDRIEQNQEQLEFIADEQNTINQRLLASDVIEQNLIENKKDILAVLREQLVALEFQLALDKNNENLQTLVLEKKREINKEGANTEKQLTRINKQQDDLNRKLAEEVAKRRESARLEQEAFEFEVREANAPPVSLEQAAVSTSSLSDPIIAQSKERQKQYADELKTVEFTEDQIREQARITAEIKETLAQQDLARAEEVTGRAAALFKENTIAYKVLASAQAVISTYAGAARALSDYAAPYSYVVAGLTIAEGLAAVAEINDVEFYHGGETGPGNDHDVKGVVHANEYVTPAKVVRRPEAQPHLQALERMRGGYYDGGFVTNTNTAPAQQSLIMANALKNLPPIYTDWTEGRAVGKKVEFKERRSQFR